MSECKQYGGITRDELDKLRKDLAAEGVDVPVGDDVEIKAPFGVQLRATYDETAEMLEICITKKPFFVPESEVWKVVDTGTKPYVN